MGYAYCLGLTPHLVRVGVDDSFRNGPDMGWGLTCRHPSSARPNLFAPLGNIGLYSLFRSAGVNTIGVRGPGFNLCSHVSTTLDLGPAVVNSGSGYLKTFHL